MGLMKTFNLISETPMKPIVRGVFENVTPARMIGKVCRLQYTVHVNDRL